MSNQLHMKATRLTIFFTSILLFGFLATLGSHASASQPIIPQNPRSTLDAEPAVASGNGGDADTAGAASDFRFGLGGTTWGSNLAAIPVSVWLDLNSRNSLQFALGLGDIQPFKLHTAAAYRLTLDGDAHLGFHVGVGTQFLLSIVGYTPGFEIKALPLFGFHGSIPGLSKVSLAVDFGPEIVFSDNGSVELTVGGVAPAMGLAVHYLF